MYVTFWCISHIIRTVMKDNLNGTIPLEKKIKFVVIRQRLPKMSV